jgi:hypothetical protein
MAPAVYKLDSSDHDHIKVIPQAKAQQRHCPFKVGFCCDMKGKGTRGHNGDMMGTRGHPWGQRDIPGDKGLSPETGMSP